MDAFLGPSWRPRLKVKLNLLMIGWLSARMTVVLWARRLSDTLTHLPWTVRKRLTLLRVVVAIILIAVTATGSALYSTERARHGRAVRAYREASVVSAAETQYLRSVLLELLDEQARLAEIVLDSGGILSTGGTVYVRVLATGYSSTVDQTDDTPFLTASNTLTQPGTVALSRDLLQEFTRSAPFSLGDRIHIHGVGEFLVEDVMNARWTNRVDVWFPSQHEALWFGRRQVVISRALDDRPSDGLPILSSDFSARMALGGI